MSLVGMHSHLTFKCFVSGANLNKVVCTKLREMKMSFATSQLNGTNGPLERHSLPNKPHLKT